MLCQRAHSRAHSNPALPVNAPPSLPAPPAAPAQGLHAPIRVLVVDDDPLSRSFQTHLLSLLGHQALAQGDPLQALSLLLDEEFDLLLLDLGMPGLDGFEMLRRLREHEARTGRRPLAVIAVTGYASDADRQRCLAAGFNDHLAKPIQAAVLGTTLERVLGAARAGVPGPEASDVVRLRATVKRLNETRPGDRSFAPTVTESFALRSAQLLESLRRCVQQREASPLSRATQALKASAEFLGALRLARMCTELDQSAGRGDWTTAEQLLRLINDEHQVVLTLLFESA